MPAALCRSRVSFAGPACHLSLANPPFKPDKCEVAGRCAISSQGLPPKMTISCVCGRVACRDRFCPYSLRSSSKYNRDSANGWHRCGEFDADRSVAMV
eukprot:141352-Rhodomonas_salina.2